MAPACWFFPDAPSTSVSPFPLISYPIFSSLYHGQNSLDQHVLTWAASEPTEKFNGDISPLITRLFTMTGTGFPDKSDYLGYMGLGSEALWAQSTATFYVPVLSIDIQASRTNA